MRRGIWHSALATAVTAGMVVVITPSVAVPPPEEQWLVRAIDCTGTFGDRELVVTGYFDADFVSGGGDAEFHDGAALVWGNVEETSTYDGEDFVLDVTFVYGHPQDGEDGEVAAAEPGESAGTMTITGTATPSGTPEVESMRIREGNTWTWWTWEHQVMVGTGGIDAATGDVAFTVGADLNCGGHINTTGYGGTDPATWIEHSSPYSDARCELPGDPESFLSLGFWGEEGYAGLGIGVNWDEGTADWWAEGPIEWTGSTITGDLEVVLPEAHAGSTATLHLTVGADVVDRGMVRDKGRQFAMHERFVSHALNGTIGLPDDTEIAVVDCTITTSWSMTRYSSKAGQKPGGKPPVNDLPVGSLPLVPVSTVTQSTRGAAIAPEAPCVIDTGEGTWSVPFGRTVWYSFEGTGGDVTLSTVGTSQEFDTVMGVYEKGSSLEQVACADEGTDPKQGWAAEVTVPTTSGTSYLVQVGGFHPEESGTGPMWGDLVLTRS